MSDRVDRIWAEHDAEMKRIVDEFGQSLRADINRVFNRMIGVCVVIAVVCAGLALLARSCS